MVAIKALTGIATQKRNAIVRCLDDLLCEGTISGYNWYTQPAICDRVVTLSHIHETEAYKKALLEDLEQQGYDPETLSGYFRDKGSSFRWDLDFNIRDSAERLLPGLTVKRWQTGKFLELERYANNLGEYQEFHGEQLIGTDSGWELDLPFQSKKELLRLVALFLQKGSKYLTDPEGNRVIESGVEVAKRSPWPDAYETPVIILGAHARRYASELPHFDEAVQFLYIENMNEISFIIHNKLSILRDGPQVQRLKSLGFSQQACFANKRFLSFLDKT